MNKLNSIHIELKEDDKVFYITNKECSGGVEIIYAQKPREVDAPIFENTDKIARIYMPEDKFLQLVKALQFEAEKIQNRKKKSTFELRYGYEEEEKKKTTDKKKPTKKATTKAKKKA